MNNLFSEFESVSKEIWHDKLKTDLRGKSTDLLLQRNEIEEIDFSSVIHKTDSIDLPDPGVYSYTRGNNNPDNSWNNGSTIVVELEEKANQEALQALMSGANLLVFLSAKSDIEWKVVLQEIKVDHIQIQIEECSFADYETIRNLTDNHQNVQYNFDLANTSLVSNQVRQIMDALVVRQTRVFVSNGYDVQQCGANASQEITYCLSAAHETLVLLLEHGLDIDEAAACISFKLGIGNDYFLETAKFRALRSLWASIVSEYDPKHNCSHNCSITAVVGIMNKSIRDPHTNLLRQTTEAMSAINASVDSIVIHPHDTNSIEGPSELAKRMALNISLILKEEVYLDKVIDPLGGSYSLEKLTQLLKEKSWESFLKMDHQGGVILDENWTIFRNEIERTKSKRISLTNELNQVLIGVNKYQNIEGETTLSLNETRSYRGVNHLILEKEFVEND